MGLKYEKERDVNRVRRTCTGGVERTPSMSMRHHVIRLRIYGNLNVDWLARLITHTYTHIYTHRDGACQVRTLTAFGVLLV